MPAPKAQGNENRKSSNALGSPSVQTQSNPARSRPPPNHQSISRTATAPCRSSPAHRRPTTHALSTPPPTGSFHARLRRASPAAAFPWPPVPASAYVSPTPTLRSSRSTSPFSASPSVPTLSSSPPTQPAAGVQLPALNCAPVWRRDPGPGRVVPPAVDRLRLRRARRPQPPALPVPHARAAGRSSILANPPAAWPRAPPSFASTHNRRA